MPLAQTLHYILLMPIYMLIARIIGYALFFFFAYLSFKKLKWLSFAFLPVFLILLMLYVKNREYLKKMENDAIAYYEDYKWHKMQEAIAADLAKKAQDSAIFAANQKKIKPPAEEKIKTIETIQAKNSTTKSASLTEVEDSAKVSENTESNEYIKPEKSAKILWSKNDTIFYEDSVVFLNAKKERVVFLKEFEFFLNPNGSWCEWILPRCDFIGYSTDTKIKKEWKSVPFYYGTSSYIRLASTSGKREKAIFYYNCKK